MPSAPPGGRLSDWLEIQMLSVASFHQWKRSAFLIAASINRAHSRARGGFQLLYPLCFARRLRIISFLPTSFPEHASEDDEGEDKSDPFETKTVTRPNQYGDKGTASSKAEFDYDSNPRRQTGPIKAIPGLVLPNELPVIGPNVKNRTLFQNPVEYDDKGAQRPMS